MFVKLEGQESCENLTFIIFHLLYLVNDDIVRLRERPCWLGMDISKA